MTHIVVLYNIDTNMYLSSKSPLTTSKDWKEAFGFESEELALEYLSKKINIFCENKLCYWCTRNVYTLQMDGFPLGERVELVAVRGDKVFKKIIDYSEFAKLKRKKGWHYYTYQIGFSQF